MLSEGERRGLRLLAVMYVFTAFGNVLWYVDELLRGVDPRYSGANVFFVLSYAVAIVALWRYPVAPRAPRELKKFLLDAGCVLVSVAALIWTFDVAPITWASLNPVMMMMEIAYPVACIVVLALVCRLIMNRTPGAARFDMIVLTSALALQCALDLVLATQYRIGPLPEPFWVCLLYPVTYILVIWAADLAVRASASDQPHQALRPVNPLTLLPTITGVALYVALVWVAQSDTRQPMGVLIGAAIIMNLMFFARQALALHENAELHAARAAAESRAHYESKAREGQKMESIGRLAGGVAHDFNNLLTTVLANSDFALTRMRPGDPAHDEVSDIRSAALRGAELVRQLLAFSRKSVVSPVRLDVGQVLRELERLLQGLSGERCSLLLELAPDLGISRMDRGQLETVFVTLVSNARDAMPPEGGAIVISAQNVNIDLATANALDLPLGDYVAIAVHDSGVGMPPEVQVHLFEPFYSTKERGKGTGLGLASTYGILRQSGGAIEVESEVGVGTTFRLYLPRIITEVTTRTPTPIPGASDRSESHPETILLVEDQTAVRQVTKRILTTEGYRVLTAADAVAARQMLERHGDEIAVMVTDVMMPGETGPELAVSIADRWPQISVIYISGYSHNELPERDSAAMQDEILEKPFTGMQLLARVEAALRPHRAGRPRDGRTQS